MARKFKWNMWNYDCDGNAYIIAADECPNRADVPSYIVKEGDIVAVKESKTSNKYFEAIKSAKAANLPKWLEFNPEKLEGKVIALPARDDIDSQIAEHMIVELYSK